MTDEEYIFRTECAEKKRTARGSFNRLSHAGRGGRVKMPSDYMTKKERDKMNGEVQSYNLNRPMQWKQFKRMPDDIQREYINSLIEKFDPQQTAIAEMLGVSAGTLNKLCRERLGISFERGGAHGEGRNAAFWAWAKGTTEAEQEAAPEADEKPAQKATGGGRSAGKWYAGILGYHSAGRIQRGVCVAYNDDNAQGRYIMGGGA